MLDIATPDHHRIDLLPLRMDGANGSLKGPKASKASKVSKSKAAMNGSIKSALNGHAAHPKTAIRTAGPGVIWRTLGVAARYASFSPSTAHSNVIRSCLHRWRVSGTAIVL